MALQLRLGQSKVKKTSTSGGEHIIFVKDPDKMPNKCSVPECSGRGGFTFPSDPEKRLKWKTAVKISWDPSVWSTVCESHFKPEDFKESIRAEEPAKKRRRVLELTAVPSIYPSTPPSSSGSTSPHPGPSHAPDAYDTPDAPDDGLRPPAPVDVHVVAPPEVVQQVTGKYTQLPFIRDTVDFRLVCPKNFAEF